MTQPWQDALLSRLLLRKVLFSLFNAASFNLHILRPYLILSIATYTKRQAVFEFRSQQPASSSKILVNKPIQNHQRIPKHIMHLIPISHGDLIRLDPCVNIFYLRKTKFGMLCNIFWMIVRKL